MGKELHPKATEHIPFFITAPGETDVLMIVLAVVLAFAAIGFGTFYFKLITLPQRMASTSVKVQAELVGILGLIALFTHMHIFWIIGLILSFITFPDLRTPLMRVAGSVEKAAGLKPGAGDVAMPRKADLLAAYRQEQAEASAANATSQAETPVAQAIKPLPAHGTAV